MLLFFAAAAAADGLERISIWPGGAPREPGGPTELVVTERAQTGDELRDRYATHIVDPDLTVFEANDPSGCGMLILPGGGYVRVVMDKEGYESAEWFAARGIPSFVMRYRLPGEYAEPRPDLSLKDAQRALRVIRARAGEYGIDTDCVGVMGFSAGGHLAGLLATASEADAYEAVDDVDRHSARADFAVLMYPVVSMKEGIAHAGSRRHLLGTAPSAQAIERYSVEERVTPRTPPVFLLHAADDDAVDVENSLALHRALTEAGVPVDLHVYAEGGHGFGMRRATDKPVARWPELVYRWIPSGYAENHQETWRLDNLENIAGHEIMVEGDPGIIDTPDGKAIEFDGVDDGIFLDVHPLAGMSAFTVEVIFKPYQGGAPEQRFFHMQENRSEARVMFETRLVRNARWFLDTFIKSGDRNVALYASDNEHPIGSWYHAAMVVDENSFEHFVNGRRELSEEMQFEAPQAGKTSLGVRLNRVHWFKGAIRTVRFTPRALAPEEFLTAED